MREEKGKKHAECKSSGVQLAFGYEYLPSCVLTQGQSRTSRNTDLVVGLPAGVQPRWIQGDSKVGMESASLEKYIFNHGSRRVGHNWATELTELRAFTEAWFVKMLYHKLIQRKFIFLCYGTKWTEKNSCKKENPFNRDQVSFQHVSFLLPGIFSMI